MAGPLLQPGGLPEGSRGWSVRDTAVGRFTGQPPGVRYAYTTEKLHMHFLKQLLPVSLIALATTAMAQITYTDGEFAPAQWDLHVRRSRTGGGSVSTAQRLTEGNPAACRWVATQLPSEREIGIHAYHICSLFIYEPRVHGPICAFSYSFNCRVFTSYGSGVGLAIRQGTNYFSDCEHDGSDQAVQSGGWRTFSKQQSPLNSVWSDGGASLDFSPTAPPIEFGIATWGSVSIQLPPPDDLYTELLLDNYSITVFPTPRPTIRRSGQMIQIEWDWPNANAVLESSSELGAAQSWSVVTNAVTVNGNTRTLTVTPSEAKKFYRLRCG